MVALNLIETVMLRSKMAPSCKVITTGTPNIPALSFVVYSSSVKLTLAPKTNYVEQNLLTIINSRKIIIICNVICDEHVL